MFNRWIEENLFDVLAQQGMGCICFSPLAQGLLTNRYLGGDIPADSRAAGSVGFLRPERVTEEKLAKVRLLNQVAQARGQSMAQLALAWILRHKGVTSALVGASKPSQVEDSVGALAKLEISAEELQTIEAILAQ
jgi:L-glyceraldehyde 3-phosphate reductase